MATPRTTDQGNTGEAYDPVTGQWYSNGVFDPVSKQFLFMGDDGQLYAKNPNGTMILSQQFDEKQNKFTGPNYIPPPTGGVTDKSLAEQLAEFLNGQSAANEASKKDTIEAERIRAAADKQMESMKESSDANIAGVSSVGDLQKQLETERNPKTVYDWRYNTHGLATPRGSSTPGALPYTQAQTNAYNSQGVPMGALEKQLGGSGVFGASAPLAPPPPPISDYKSNTGGGASTAEAIRANTDVQLQQMRDADALNKANTGSVDALQKLQMGATGPKDPFAYLFNVRGDATPAGYSNAAMPFTQAQIDSYSKNGVGLSQLQNQFSPNGPNFMQGALGSSRIEDSMKAPGMASGGTIPGLEGGGYVPSLPPHPDFRMMAAGGSFPPMSGPPMSDPMSGPPPGPPMSGQPPMMGGQPGMPPPGMAPQGPPMADPGASPMSAQGPGMMANQPTAIVGEGNPKFPEFVIPTDPAFRDHAMQLLGHLLQYFANEFSGMNPGEAPGQGGPQMPGQGPGQPPMMASGGMVPLPPFDPSAPLGPPALGTGFAPQTPPPGGSPMESSQMDPFTRSVVDKFGRPQILSAWSQNQASPSEMDAYNNYISAVAGGNPSDFTDRGQIDKLAPQGARTGGKFSTVPTVAS